MAILQLLKGSAFGPEQIKVMTEAYEATLKSLHLKAGTDPINEIIAKKIEQPTLSGPGGILV